MRRSLEEGRCQLVLMVDARCRRDVRVPICERENCSWSSAIESGDATCQDWSADYDKDEVDEIVLALLSLTPCGGGRAWKRHEWGALGRLHQKRDDLRPHLENRIGIAYEVEKSVPRNSFKSTSSFRVDAFGVAQFPTHLDDSQRQDLLLTANFWRQASLPTGRLARLTDVSVRSETP